MKNKLTDLQNHLCAQLERLNDKDLEGEKLMREMSRAGATTAMARNIIVMENVRTGMKPPLELTE
jgi:hypothetical protein